MFPARGWNWQSRPKPARMDRGGIWGETRSAADRCATVTKQSPARETGQSATPLRSRGHRGRSMGCAHKALYAGKAADAWVGRSRSPVDTSTINCESTSSAHIAATASGRLDRCTRLRRATRAQQPNRPPNPPYISHVGERTISARALPGSDGRAMRPHAEPWVKYPGLGWLGRGTRAVAALFLPRSPVPAPRAPAGRVGTLAAGGLFGLSALMAAVACDRTPLVSSPCGSVTTVSELTPLTLTITGNFPVTGSTQLVLIVTTPSNGTRQFMSSSMTTTQAVMPVNSLPLLRTGNYPSVWKMFGCQSAQQTQIIGPATVNITT
jgi:hypothetical protein